MTKKRIAIIALSALAAVAVVAGSILALFCGTVSSGRDNLLAPDSLDPEVMTVERNGETYRYNTNMASILFIGSDQENGRSRNSDGSSPFAGNGQADALMLLAFDTSDGSLECIAIPRETMCEIEESSPINDLTITKTNYLCLEYSYGNDDMDSGRLMCEAVSNLMDGIPVEYFYTLNMSGVGDLADAVGGVDLVALSDVTKTDMQAGQELHLTGQSAVDYVWQRDVLDDLSPGDRLERQKQFIEAFAAKALEECKGNPLKLMELFDVAKSCSVTNLDTNELAFLASALAENGISSIETKSIPGKLTPVPEKPTQFLADEAGITDLILNAYYTKA